MRRIGGNTKAILQTCTATMNAIGERVNVWKTKATLRGWLDLQAGDSKYLTYNAKVQESTHIFVCDAVALDGVSAENSRLVVNGAIYDVTLIDEPMGLGYQLEIYLRYVGGRADG